MRTKIKASYAFCLKYDTD